MWRAIFLLVLLTYSCKTEEIKKPKKYPYQLSKTGEITLPLDDETSYEMYYLDYLKDGEEELLYTWNHLINGINIFSLTEKEQVKKIKIPREGPNSIRSLQGFTLINKDSIFIYGRGATHTARLINSKGVLLDGGFVKRNTSMSIINHVSNDMSPTYKYGNYLCFFQLPIMDLSDPNNINDKFEFEIWYDLEKGTYRNMGITFPKSYQGKIWGTYNYVASRKKGHDNYFVYSWPVKHEIFVTDFSENEKWVNAALDAAEGNVPKALNYGHSDEEALQEVIGNYTYRNIYYDKSRQVYYRTVIGPIKELPSDDYTVMQYQPVYVVILNKDFEKIGEVELDANKYTFASWFIGEKGLYIPQIKPTNPDLKEDEVVFSIYNLQEASNEN